MKKIDELISKILQLQPNRLHEIGSNSYYLFYKDITICFWNMDYKIRGLARINNNEAEYISEDNRLLVLKYFNKKHKINDLLIKVNKDLRKKKLLTINETV
jgi:hypothetical protein